MAGSARGSIQLMQQGLGPKSELLGEMNCRPRPFRSEVKIIDERSHQMKPASALGRRQAPSGERLLIVEACTGVDHGDLAQAVADLDLNLVLIGRPRNMGEDVGTRLRECDLHVFDARFGYPNPSECRMEQMPDKRDARCLPRQTQGEGQFHIMRIPTYAPPKLQPKKTSAALKSSGSRVFSCPTASDS
jgi:hypothetical protein